MNYLKMDQRQGDLRWVNKGTDWGPGKVDKRYDVGLTGDIVSIVTR